MNWLREIRSVFVIVPGLCALGCVWFLFNARAAWNDASTSFNRIRAELNRLEGLTPFPSGENLRQMQVYADEYGAAVAKLKDELRTRVLPLSRLAPNEFQSHLRVAMDTVAEKARANRVRLPDGFHLGFDEYASALPNEAAASLLGQELAQVEWILNTLLEAHVDSLISFRRAPLPEEHGSPSVVVIPTSAGRKPGISASTAPEVLERNMVEATFVSTPAAARKVLNLIAGANEQFFVVRLLRIRNEKDNGPLREVAANGAGDARVAASPVPASAPKTKTPTGAALNFIVGNERIEMTAKIEMMRFAFEDDDGESGE